MCNRRRVLWRANAMHRSMKRAVFSPATPKNCWRFSHCSVGLPRPCAMQIGHRPILIAAIDRIAPTLRTLRHADGALARFHGGGRGIDGRLDHALIQSGNRNLHVDGLAMGYARIAAGRTSIVIDAALPPGARIGQRPCVDLGV